MRPSVLSIVDRARLFGSPRFKEIGKGLVALDSTWQRDNIVLINLPELKGVQSYGGPSSGNVQVHKLAVESFRAVFREIGKQGLRGDLLFYAGAFYPRHIGNNPARPLSSHSFGIAIDLNPDQNGYGKPPARAGTKGSVRRLVPIFAKYGFAWGGDWNANEIESDESLRTRDGMHFELARLP